jgi:hypothetical protein
MIIVAVLRADETDNPGEVVGLGGRSVFVVVVVEVGQEVLVGCFVGVPVGCVGVGVYPARTIMI